MKKKKTIIILGAIIAAVITAVVFAAELSNWSNLSYEAIVQEMAAMPDGEIRLIVERTTEIYANPLNSLHIGEKTKTLDTDGKTISVEELQPGSNENIIQLCLRFCENSSILNIGPMNYLKRGLL